MPGLPELAARECVDLGSPWVVSSLPTRYVTVAALVREFAEAADERTLSLGSG
jgi:hypothetical protein